MPEPAIKIPDKTYFKIGEVCRLTDTQPYVLRFWESEFPTLAPQKSRSGQRLYRREDIEMVLRIKKLLYEESYTIAGARKQLEAGAPLEPVRLRAVPVVDEEPSQTERRLENLRAELVDLLTLLGSDGTNSG